MSTTPHHDAAFNGKLECCNIYINHGINVNITGMHSSILLHEAGRSGSLKCCELFLNDINW